MTHQDEYERLIEYSEMTAFNFNSKEYEEMRRDYYECKDFISGLMWKVKSFANKLRTA